MCASGQVSPSLNQRVTLNRRRASARVSRKGTRAGAVRPAGTRRRVAGAPQGQGDERVGARGDGESASLGSAGAWVVLQGGDPDAKGKRLAGWR